VPWPEGLILKRFEIAQDLRHRWHHLLRVLGEHKEIGDCVELGSK
jgi:hypothetical protein